MEILILLAIIVGIALLVRLQIRQHEELVSLFKSKPAPLPRSVKNQISDDDPDSVPLDENDFNVLHNVKLEMEEDSQSPPGFDTKD